MAIHVCTEWYTHTDNGVLYTLDEHCVSSGMFVSVLTMVCRLTGAQRVYDHTPSHFGHHCSISILCYIIYCVLSVIAYVYSCYQFCKPSAHSNNPSLTHYTQK